MNEHRVCARERERERELNGFGVSKDDLGGVRGETHVNPENVLRWKSGNLKTPGAGECGRNRSLLYGKTSAMRRLDDDV